MGIFQVSLLPIAAVVVWSFIFGMIWYSPKVLGNVWMKELKVTPSKEMKKPMLIEFIGNSISGYVLTLLVSWLKPEDIIQSILLAIVLWAGLILPLLFSRIAWEGSSTKGVMVNLVGGLLVTIGSVLIIFHLI